MTFDEFFKKKRIDLVTLEKADGRLFSEFKTHFEQMGEKSFDHTKKYWFNKLRHEFPLAVEVKADKVKIDNPLAQQTVTEVLTEVIEPPAPKLGFTPKFKAAPPAQPPAADDKPKAAAPKPAFTPRFKPGVTKPTVEENKTTEGVTPAAEDPSTAPKLGFTPKFKAGVTKPAAEEQPARPAAEQPTAETTAPKLGFKPKFKAGLTKPAEETQPTPAAAEEQPAAETATPKLGFTPKFKAGITKPATEAQPSAPAAEEKAEEPNPTTETPTAAPAPKLGFKPKFKAANMPKPATEEKSEESAQEPEKQQDNAAGSNEPAPEPKAPQPYKPRFNMKNMPPKAE